MGLARSTYYDEPEIQPIDEARLVEQIKEVCAEWPAYGYRRVTAELHGEGRIVNHKKVMRLMKENGLSVRPRRRFIATTDSDHDGPIFPNLAKNIVPTNLNQLWVAKYDAGGLDSDAAAADVLADYEARIAALERLVGKLALENEFLKGASRHVRQLRSASTSVVAGPVVSQSQKDAG